MHKQTRWGAALLALALIASPAAYAEDALHNVIDDAWSAPGGFLFSGRLTEVRAPADADSSRVGTLYRTSRMLLTSGEEGPVRWQVGGLDWQTRSDDDGYWSLRGNHALPLAPGWHLIRSTPPASSDAYMLVHDERNTRGVISDIDDTIMVSQVNQKGDLLANSLTVPPEQRQAVTGVAGFYQQLLGQNPNPQLAPMFYVSASPRQLTDNLRRFLRHNGFPRGVMALKEVGPSQAGGSLTDQRDYKYARISAILRDFPRVSFVLVGDDGEQDPEIFQRLQKEFPKQVSAIWIRRVNPDPQRPRYPGQGDLATQLRRAR